MAPVGHAIAIAIGFTICDFIDIGDAIVIAVIQHAVAFRDVLALDIPFIAAEWIDFAEPLATLGAVSLRFAALFTRMCDRGKSKGGNSHQAESRTWTPISRNAPPPFWIKPRLQAGMPWRRMLRARA